MMRLINVKADYETVKKKLIPALIRAAWVLVLLLVYIIVKELLELYSSKFSETDFYKPMFVISALQKGLLLWIVTAAFFGYLIYKGRLEDLSQRWSCFENGRELGWLTTLIAGILVWSYSFYDYNLYYNNGHYFERLLLLGFGVGLIWRPVFLIPYLWILVAIIAQFRYPFGVGFEYPVDDLLVGCLFLTCAWFLFSNLTGKRDIDGLFVLICSLIAGYYFGPGYGKIKVDWFEYNQVGLFAASAYAHGWLSNLSTETVESLLRFTLKINPLLIVFTLIAELCGVLVLLRRGMLKVLIVIWTIFHIGVFLMSGYLFWKWIFIEWAIWIIFLRKKSKSKLNVFRKEYVVLSFILIFWCHRWAHPPRLSWFDTGLDYYYRFEAILENGDTRNLNPDIFSPYTNIFSFTDFHYISDDAQLLQSYGATGDQLLARKIYDSSSLSEILEFKQYLPDKQGLLEDRRRFVNFIEVFFSNLSSRMREKQIFFRIQPLATFWSGLTDYNISDLENIRTVRVTRVITYFNGETFTKNPPEFIMDIEISSE